MSDKLQRYSLVEVTPADGSEPYADIREREDGGLCMWEDVEQLKTENELLRAACEDAAQCFRRAIPWSARKPIDAVLVRITAEPIPEIDTSVDSEG